MTTEKLPFHDLFPAFLNAADNIYKLHVPYYILSTNCFFLLKNSVKNV